MYVGYVDCVLCACMYVWYMNVCWLGTYVCKASALCGSHSRLLAANGTLDALYKSDMLTSCQLLGVHSPFNTKNKQLQSALS